MTRHQMLKQKLERQRLLEQQAQEKLITVEKATITPEEYKQAYTYFMKGKELQRYLRDAQKLPVAVVLRKQDGNYFYQVRGSRPLFKEWENLKVDYISEVGIIAQPGVHDK